MFNIKKSLAVGLVAGAGLLSSVGAHAVVVDVPPGDTLERTLFSGGGTSFNNSFAFTLGGVSDLNGLSILFNLSNFTVSLSQGANVISGSTPSPNPCATFSACNAFAYTGLGPGSYLLSLSGVSSGAPFAAAMTTLRVMPAVPEPATVALALMAAGLLGGMTMRNRKNKI